jgi:hypothetical protein
MHGRVGGGIMFGRKERAMAEQVLIYGKDT